MKIFTLPERKMNVTPCHLTASLPKPRRSCQRSDPRSRNELHVSSDVRSRRRCAGRSRGSSRQKDARFSVDMWCKSDRFVAWDLINKNFMLNNLSCALMTKVWTYEYARLLTETLDKPVIDEEHKLHFLRWIIQIRYVSVDSKLERVIIRWELHQFSKNRNIFLIN